MQQSILVNFQTGQLFGAAVSETVRRLADLDGTFLDNAAYRAMDHSQVIYRVQALQPVADDVEGGLFWGATFIEPGRVGDEYFMTKGHFHAKLNRAEYYVTVRGAGALILMSEDRKSRVEFMTPGSVHYIPGWTAHRVANIGEERLSFLACWPSDAGHDYARIAKDGFSARMRCIDGKPRLVEAV